MAQVDSLQEILEASKNAQALGRYNEATVLLYDYVKGNSVGDGEALPSLNIRIELAINYLYQGYLKRAHEILNYRLEEMMDIIRDARDPEGALFGLLSVVVELRRWRGGDPTWIATCGSVCIEVWEKHLKDLGLGGHTPTLVRLEILVQETRYDILLQQRDCAVYDNFVIARLVTICRQLYAEKRYSEALEVAQLLRKLAPAVPCGLPHSNHLSLGETAQLYLLHGDLDKAEEFYRASGHIHGHLDASAFRFQRQLLQQATPVEEMDRAANDLVTSYEDVDYPKGALFVLHQLLVWKSKLGLTFASYQAERVRSLEAQTGELLRLTGLDPIPFSSDRASTQPSLLEKQSIPIAQRAPTHHDAQTTFQGPPISDAMSRNSQYSKGEARSQSSLAQPRLSSKWSRNPLSRLSDFVRGDFSEERLSASGPLSALETIFLAGNIYRNAGRHKMGDYHNPSLFRNIRVLSERLPSYLQHIQPSLQELVQLLPESSDTDPAQAIENAEAILRANADRPLSECWLIVSTAHFKLALYYQRLLNLDKALHHCHMAKAAAENAPGSLGADLLLYLEILQLSGEMRKVFIPGEAIDGLKIESARQKILQLLSAVKDPQPKNILVLMLNMVETTSRSENLRPLPKTIAGPIVWTPEQDIIVDMMNTALRASHPAAVEADFDALKQKLQVLEEILEKEETPSKAMARSAASGYFALGHAHTIRALESDPPSIELLHSARLYHQAALGVIERVCPQEALNTYADSLWGAGVTWKYEGVVSRDPADYQRAIQEFQDTERIINESRILQETAEHDPLQILMAKQNVVSRFEAVRIYTEIFHCCWVAASLSTNETQRSSFFMQAWESVQKQKARGLLDVMSLGAIIPAYMLQAIQKFPEQNSLLLEEARLMAALSGLPPIDRTAIRSSLRDLRHRMKQFPYLNAALRARDGEGFNLEDLSNLTMQIRNIGTRVVFVDWIIHGGFIFLFAARCNGTHYQVLCYRLNIQQSTVSAWVRSNLNTRLLSNNEDSYYRFKEIKDLIAPLKSATSPGDMLVLCPTSILHGIPLHALEIDDTQILLERNPVAYIPSLSILRHQVDVSENDMTMQNLPPWRASIVSAYDSSDPQNPAQEVVAVRNCLSGLASALGTVVQSGPHINVPYFRDHVSGANLIHFHGHAIFTQRAEDQALVLQPSTGSSPSDLSHHLTARSIFTSVRLSRNPLVVNIACASGRQEIKPGDEPFGLTTAFHFAGANSVIGTLWPLKSSDGRSFTTSFYEAIREQIKGQSRGSIVDLAQAVRKAALGIRDVDETEAPYHWASFVVSGLWEHSFGGEIGELGR